MKILYPRVILNRFRKQCRLAFPNETIAVLHGARNQAGDILITDIVAIPHVGTEGEVDYRRHGQVRSSKMKALRAKQDWIGTIHSHPTTDEDQCCWHPSDADIKIALADGEVVMGIVYVFEKGSRTSVHWYVPAAPPVSEPY